MYGDLIEAVNCPLKFINLHFKMIPSNDVKAVF